jgi:hypothetical protein
MLISTTSQTPLPIQYMRMWRQANPNHERNYYINMFRLLREAYGNQCLDCGCGYSLEFAHIKETTISGKGRGMRIRFYDIINNPCSYILMCKKCHEHHDSLPKEERETFIYEKLHSLGYDKEEISQP